MMKAALKAHRDGSSYETDLCAWTEEQARLLRERRFDELDVPNLIDEVPSVGGSERQNIESRLDIQIGHLPKWMYQPGSRNSHWVGTIPEQRRRIARVVKSSPSLKRYPAVVFEECYLAGRLLAAKEKGHRSDALPRAAALLTRTGAGRGLHATRAEFPGQLKR